MKISIAELEAKREEEDVEPFEIELGEDHVLTMPHPVDIPADQLVNFDSEQPAAVLRSILGDEGFNDLLSDGRVTIGMAGEILDRYNEHYGLTSRRGERAASPRSSNGSARPSKSTSGSRGKPKRS